MCVGSVHGFMLSVYCDVLVAMGVLWVYLSDVTLLTLLVIPLK